MGKVTVKFYQDVRDAAGVPSVEVETEGPTPLTLFLNNLAERFEKLKPMLANLQTERAAVIVLVNGRAPIPPSSAVLVGGEEISILPMVEGG
ncbi:MAG: MoaD/ThiS family protein [Candidatus Methanomethylicaceae archaeon]|nr:MoaD/ThiS family protein [Candidatus Verstraetearchaeota archaeon]